MQRLRPATNLNASVVIRNLAKTFGSTNLHFGGRRRSEARKLRAAAHRRGCRLQVSKISTSGTTHDKDRTPMPVYTHYQVHEVGDGRSSWRQRALSLDQTSGSTIDVYTNLNCKYAALCCLSENLSTNPPHCSLFYRNKPPMATTTQTATDMNSTREIVGRCAANVGSRTHWVA